MKKITIIFMFLFTWLSYSQDNSKRIYEYITSTEKKWKIIKLRDTINAKIIFHIPAQRDCDENLVASMTIVKTQKGDTIRILDLCNSNKFQIDQNIKIAPAQKQSFIKVSVPFSFDENLETKMSEPNLKYDLKVLKTAWGKLIE
ncbi:hypothetical protein [Flavobacterium sp. GT3R68]|uniref:hypothetical protein n=1 Tax=Flavobacterium sp. GT3R68 TaxID=2594437 RepID=UPI000F86CF77|nr:hypothetical protein [Flavobacterium sp. GT3R68]RTY85909.1 hypothetical protein EKL32_28230 [Flavobacterium sp. GSN2]TRW89343.1 hypothetical protein FNW07_13510 [Flavobacterium sp. GT3R68]